MRFHNVMVENCADPALREAFCAYYGELGCRVTDWDGFFAEVSEGDDSILIRRDETGRILGFLMLAIAGATAWDGFFAARMGCVEEFWVAPPERGKGHGSALLANAEAWLREQGCAFAILTTDTAPDFYRRRGYALQPGITARNGSPVFVKTLA